MARPEKKRHVVFSLDYDSSGDVAFSDQFTEEYVSKCKNEYVSKIKDILARGKKKYLDYLKSKKTDEILSVKVLDGSTRQDHPTDRQNNNENNNGLCLENFPKLCKEHGWDFIPLLYPDVLANNGQVNENLQVGFTLNNPHINIASNTEQYSKFAQQTGEIATKLQETLDLDEDVNKKALTFHTKSQLLISQLQYISQTHKGVETDFYFLDDQEDILEYLEEYFRKPGNLPQGINLFLVQQDYIADCLKERCRLSYSSKPSPQRAALETLGLGIIGPIPYFGAAFFMAAAVQEKSLADTGQIVFNFLSEHKNLVIMGASIYIFFAIFFALCAMQQARSPSRCVPGTPHLPTEEKESCSASITSSS